MAKLTRQRRARLNLDAEYLALSDAYKEQNPYCVRCGTSQSLETDHIVCGTGRAASLLNSDTWINQCSTCHAKQWSKAEKAAAKIVHVLATIERLSQRNFSLEDDTLILTAVRERRAGFRR